jgi:hypothetical protein
VQFMGCCLQAQHWNVAVIIAFKKQLIILQDGEVIDREIDFILLKE